MNTRPYIMYIAMPINDYFLLKILLYLFTKLFQVGIKIIKINKLMKWYQDTDLSNNYVVEI